MEIKFLKNFRNFQTIGRPERGSNHFFKCSTVGMRRSIEAWIKGIKLVVSENYGREDRKKTHYKNNSWIFFEPLGF